MNVTVFQALSIFIKKNRHDKVTIDQIMPIYLRGIKKAEDVHLLKSIFCSPSLKEMCVTSSLSEQVKDPTRHYFESILAMEYLCESIDSIDHALLNNLYHLQFNKMGEYFKTHVPETVFKNKNLHVVADRNLGEEEYAALIAELKSEDGVEFLRPSVTETITEAVANQIHRERREKLLLIVKIAFCAVVCVQLNDNDYPIPIYFQKTGPFTTENRGRVVIREPVQHRSNVSLRSQSYGIMRTTMPLYHDSPLLAGRPFNYGKPTDRSTYVEGSAWALRVEAKQVIPFVNSISGTLLMQLRMTKKLMDERSYPYQTEPQQLYLFYQLYISCLLYLSGGHCLEEWCAVFECTKVQAAFSNLRGFENLTIERLFLNGVATTNALEATLEYTERFLMKKQLMNTLLQREYVPEREVYTSAAKLG